MPPPRGYVWRWRLPTPVVLALGVALGLLLSRWIFNPAPEAKVWSPATRLRSGPADWWHRNAQPALPSLEQRRRVLELIGNLSPHHTKECTRHVSPVYAAQAHDRYDVLVGHEVPPEEHDGKLLSRLFGGSAKDGKKHRRKSKWDGVKDPFLDRAEGLRRELSRAASDTSRTPSSHKYFFAINLYNSFDIIPDLFAMLFKVSAVLGYQNVFVSIYENGSRDQTKALLRLFDALSRTLGLRVVIRSSNRKRGAFHHRIEYLAEVRNSAFVPLHELREHQGEVFDTIVFMNDVLPCVDDILELIWQSRRQNAGITCAADYMFHDYLGMPVFYDNWVSRDINGTALENAPFERVFAHPDSKQRFQRHLPIQMQSCWNGIAVLDPAPFYDVEPVKFRMANIAEEECSASECSLICNDYAERGYGRILMVPRVKLAYDKRVFDIIHPDRRNLTAVRGYKRLGGRPDDPRSDPQDRSWFGPHDRLFVDEEYEEIEFVDGPDYVWCWGWDGAGDLQGPDVEPVWEPLPAPRRQATAVYHDRGLEL